MIDTSGIETRKANEPKFKSIHQLFLRAANEIHHPDRTYLFQKTKGKWEEFSYRYILDHVDYVASFFINQGLQKGDRVAIMLENCPQYYFIDQAIQKLGLVNVSIYPTLTPEETAFILNDSGSKLIFAGNAFLLKKFQKIQDKCPTVSKAIFVPSGIEETETVVNFTTIVEQGKNSASELVAEIQNRFEQVEKNDLSTLIYTSGTTGVPKGAMLSHYNFMSNCYDAKELCPAIGSDDLYLSYLPLSHVFERMATMYLGIYVGAQVAFAESIDKVASNINEIRPSVMATVPRLLERVHEKVVQNATAGGGFKSKVFWWALGIGEAHRKAQDNGGAGIFLSLKQKLADKLVFSKIKLKMGGRLKMFVSGGGALPQHVGEFFANLGFKVQEGYGLTETSPFVTVNEFERQVYGTVGRVAPRQMVAIQNIDTLEIVTVQSYDSFKPDFQSGEGEILTKGPNVMLGYWQNKAETDNVIDSEGWFHTGDIGRFDRGYLKITDRLKNMLKTSLGKNIYPTQIENVYLQSRRIDQIFIIGDKREFLTAIIVPNLETLKEEMPDKLAATTIEGNFILDEDIKNWLVADAKKLSNSLAKFERIKDFLVKKDPFSIEAGDMTITLKIKRKVVMERYADEIEAMYLNTTCPV